MPEPFSKTQRLLTARDYREVFADVTVKAGQREFLLLARPGRTSCHRLGLAVAKKHVPLAVGRNRIKRIARECFRHLPGDQKPLDIILLTRPGAANLDRLQTARSISHQLHRILKRAAA